MQKMPPVVVAAAVEVTLTTEVVLVVVDTGVESGATMTTAVEVEGEAEVAIMEVGEVEMTEAVIADRVVIEGIVGVEVEDTAMTTSDLDQVRIDVCWDMVRVSARPRTDVRIEVEGVR